MTLKEKIENARGDTQVVSKFLNSPAIGTVKPNEELAALSNLNAVLDDVERFLTCVTSATK